MYKLLSSPFVHLLYMHACAYHPHFGEVNKTFLSKIGRSLLDKGQVC